MIFFFRLKRLNLNNCKIDQVDFSDTKRGDKTALFASLKSLLIAGNPLCNVSFQVFDC